MFPGRLPQCSAILNVIKKLKIGENYGDVTPKSVPIRLADFTVCNSVIYRLLFTEKELRYSSTIMASAEHKNRLANEKSPYLLQHAHNPVDWYPWGEEAFEKAKSEEKLIFLSVGYSTCHWCHVMEKESFESQSIADVMNEHFVNIKVDREERPDVDEVYMTFVQVSSGGGGWPMSVFLTPDLKPVACGTYFPPEDKWGRPGFKTILLSVAKQWKDDKQKLLNTGTKIVDILRKTTVFDVAMSEALVSGSIPSPECWELCTDQLSKHFEPLYGGFGLAPKFPQPANLLFLLNVYSRDPNAGKANDAKSMILHTLKMMYRGGIHDHIGQGFARYSTDEKWHVPHFEKMLYDQGQLAVVYSKAYLLEKDQLFADTIDDILTYVSRDLSHPEGGFFSAEDADSFPDAEASDKREGAFYVWTYDEITELLSKPIENKPDLLLADVFSYYYNVKENGNVDPSQDPHNELTNKNVLIIKHSVTETAEKFGITVEQLKSELSGAHKILYDARKKRPRPHLDNKIITAWNGLMISGYSHAANVLENADYVKRAIDAANFIKNYLYNSENGTLYRSCYTDKNGSIVQIANPIRGFLDDYAFLIRGLLDLYECSFDPFWLEWAWDLQQTQDEIFWDNGSAGYFTTPPSDDILLRLKDDQDGAEPSGNSVAVHNLLRLGSMLDSSDLTKKAGQVLSSFTSRLTRSPVSMPEMASSLMMYHDSTTQIVITGKSSDPDTEALLSVISDRLIPNHVVLLADDNTSSILYRRSDMIRRIKPINGKATAYVCRRRTCSLPVNTPEELNNLLEQHQQHG
ncbi:spermatogenesis-associated protein 20 [Lycorma delicatula]|uniref:spermatogenesis-associated protein 20 n=1 Tax=Lycorma delicatula TaxID=130591 RepID=UPI003F50F984